MTLAGSVPRCTPAGGGEAERWSGGQLLSWFALAGRKGRFSWMSRSERGRRRPLGRLMRTRRAVGRGNRLRHGDCLSGLQAAPRSTASSCQIHTGCARIVPIGPGFRQCAAPSLQVTDIDHPQPPACACRMNMAKNVRSQPRPPHGPPGSPIRRPRRAARRRRCSGSAQEGWPMRGRRPAAPRPSSRRRGARRRAA